MVDALFGEVNPSGKLPISFPRTAGHIPAFYNYKPSARRGYNLGFDVSALFSFGHGLSYTTFEYSTPKLSANTMKANGSLTVTINVKNTGSRRGAETVQMYIRDEFSSVPRPVKELKGFSKIWLDPGQTQKVSFTIDKESLSFFDKNMKWGVEKGDFTVLIGGNSQNVQEVKFVLQ
jgi:beta-glucosidase